MVISWRTYTNFAVWLWSHNCLSKDCQAELGERGKSLENDEGKLSILKTYFPGASAIDAATFMKAKSEMGRKRVLRKLIEQGLLKIRVSKKPFARKGKQKKIKMIDLEVILKDKS